MISNDKSVKFKGNAWSRERMRAGITTFNFGLIKYDIPKTFQNFKRNYRAVKVKGKRKYPRLEKDVIIDFKLVNTLDEYKIGMSENVSPEGIKFETIYTDKSLVKGQIIEIILKGARPGEEIKVLDQIAWVDHLKFSLKTKMGIKLIFLLDGDFEKVKELLK